MIYGIMWGITIGLIFHMIFMRMYRKTLQRKASNQMAEFINGNFYYIVKESEYRDRKMYLYDLEKQKKLNKF